MKTRVPYFYLGLTLVVLAVTLAGQTPIARQTQLQKIIQSQRDEILKGIQNSPSEVKRQVDSVPAIKPEQVQQVPAPAPAPMMAVVSDSQKDTLVNTITGFVQGWTTQMNKFSALSTTLAFAGVILAALATIFSKKSRAALVLAGLTTVVTLVPRVYPVEALADFYRSLASRGTSLEVSCELKVPFTVDDYKSATDQIQLLISTEGTKRPRLGNIPDVSADLAKQLPVLKNPAGGD